jgi:hypothetical protein
VLLLLSILTLFSLFMPANDAVEKAKQVVQEEAVGPQPVVGALAEPWGRGGLCGRKDGMRRTSDEEMEHRRLLLRLSAQGNIQARKELEQEYHARLYSAAQLANYTPTFSGSSFSSAAQRKVDRLLRGDDDGG